MDGNDVVVTNVKDSKDPKLLRSSLTLCKLVTGLFNLFVDPLLSLRRVLVLTVLPLVIAFCVLELDGCSSGMCMEQAAARAINHN
ncbi:unnamed protein product [Sphenostylis stenocarpa]|uniref:Uncharacterized protein n=1 Tax=Sphenostylis stenocarpa TaxID=92480 RepID=A0AA86ST81_9FABA|nr:unnamed protein product [Sphenostylis stenocarpa]